MPRFRIHTYSHTKFEVDADDAAQARKKAKAISPDTLIKTVKLLNPSEGKKQRLEERQ